VLFSSETSLIRRISGRERDSEGQLRVNEYDMHMCFLRVEEASSCALANSRDHSVGYSTTIRK
jgi:hypothetical protein